MTDEEMLQQIHERMLELEELMKDEYLEMIHREEYAMLEHELSIIDERLGNVI